MTNHKIKIRIRLDPSTQQTASDQPGQESPADSRFSVDDRKQVYDWKKLFLAAIILLLVFMGSIWLVSSMWEDDRIEALPSSPESSLSSEMPPSTQIEQNQQNLQNLIAAEPAPLLEEERDRAIDATAAAIADTSRSVEGPTPSISATEIAPIPIPLPIPAAKSTAALQNTEIPKEKSPSSSPLVTAKVVRAQLTSAIRQREPVDDIRRISLAGQPSRAIFLFLHLRDLTGETIRVDWFFQDKPVAQVLLPVGNNDWRTHASKMLNARRLGNWRVTVKDASGGLLAEFSFEVTP